VKLYSIIYIPHSNRSNGPSIFGGAGGFGAGFGRGGPMNGGYAHPMRPGPQPGGFPMQPGPSGGYPAQPGFPMQGPTPQPGAPHPMPPYSTHHQFNKPPMDPDEVFRVNAAPPSYDEVTRQTATTSARPAAEAEANTVA
jgi:hypothetical protein